MKFLYLLLSATLLAACVSLTNDITVKVQDNPDIDYNLYKTYAWAGSAEIIFDPIGQWEQPTLDTDEEVKFIINREMRAHGFHQVESNPDIYVAFAAGVDMEALGLKEDPETKKQVITKVPKAALVVALIDANTGYTVWLGQAQGEVQKQQTIENIRARIDYAITEIFKPYKQ